MLRNGMSFKNKLIIENVDFKLLLRCGNPGGYSSENTVLTASLVDPSIFSCAHLSVFGLCAEADSNLISLFIDKKKPLLSSANSREFLAFRACSNT